MRWHNQTPGDRICHHNVGILIGTADASDWYPLNKLKTLHCFHYYILFMVGFLYKQQVDHLNFGFLYKTKIFTWRFKHKIVYFQIPQYIHTSWICQLLVRNSLRWTPKEILNIFLNEKSNKVGTHIWKH